MDPNRLSEYTTQKKVAESKKSILQGMKFCSFLVAFFHFLPEFQPFKAVGQFDFTKFKTVSVRIDIVSMPQKCFMSYIRDSTVILRASNALTITAVPEKFSS